MSARDRIHAADPLLVVLDLHEELQVITAATEAMILEVHAARQETDRYQRALALYRHARAALSKAKVAEDQASRIANLSRLACQKAAEARGESGAGSFHAVIPPNNGNAPELQAAGADQTRGSDD